MRRAVAGVASMPNATFAVPVPLARAHTATDYYNTWYQPAVSYNFTTGFAYGIAGKNRVGNGIGQWNVLRPSRLTVSAVTPDVADYTPDGCATKALNQNGIHSRASSYFTNIGQAGALAITSSCVYGSNPRRIWSSNVVFNAGNVWYTGTADPVPCSCWDMWGVATHEAGHFVGSHRGVDGKGHFAFQGGANADCPVPSTNSDQTMCPVAVGGPTWASSSRSLETHDTHTFVGAYP